MTLEKTTWAEVSLQFVGMHHYPEAADAVEFLSDPHRHTFHVTVQLEQFHNNRDVEYIQFKRWLKEQLPSGDLGTASCEDIADRIYEAIDEEYPDRRVRISVTEDGENGAVVEWD